MRDDKRAAKVLAKLINKRYLHKKDQDEPFMLQLLSEADRMVSQKFQLQKVFARLGDREAFTKRFKPAYLDETDEETEVEDVDEKPYWIGLYIDMLRQRYSKYSSHKTFCVPNDYDFIRAITLESPMEIKYLTEMLEHNMGERWQGSNQRLDGFMMEVI